MKKEYLFVFKRDSKGVWDYDTFIRMDDKRSLNRQKFEVDKFIEGGFIANILESITSRKDEFKEDYIVVKFEFNGDKILLGEKVNMESVNMNFEKLQELSKWNSDLYEVTFTGYDTTDGRKFVAEIEGNDMKIIGNSLEETKVKLRGVCLSQYSKSSIFRIFSEWSKDFLTEDEKKVWDTPLRDFVGSLECPVCKESNMHPLEVMNAVSRNDNSTYICNDCGVKEMGETQ